VEGSLASRVDEHGVNFGYVLRQDGWGRGFMAEALRPVSTWWLEQGGAHRTWATCHTANVQSVRVLEKAGFTLEGTLRRWGSNPNVSPDPCDHFCYSRVRGAS
jgi:RimJ/RimL family protein N-acetyltransferase